MCCMYVCMYVLTIKSNPQSAWRLHPNQSWRWGDAERRAFEAGKALLLKPPVLAHFDPRYELVLSADASAIGIGCVLSVITPAGKRPVASFSRTLNETER